MKINLYAGRYENLYDETLNQISEEKVIERIWEKDFTLWSGKPDEIVNRLGWLNVTDYSAKFIEEINELKKYLKQDGFTDILLLGMGGSSLAPEVFGKILSTDDGLNLYILDSAHPDEIIKYNRKLNPKKTFYIVSTKSGGTIETLSFLKYFYVSAEKTIGGEKAGGRFAAITDPGSGLQKIAEELNFRKIFLNDPDIGGRFSALSLFGIVPAILCGVDGGSFLKKINFERYKYSNPENDFVCASALISAAVSAGGDKLTFMLSDKLRPFGSWIEQLIAESAGKNGKGILPVIEDSILPVEKITADRMPIIINNEDDNSFENYLSKLKQSNIPFVQFILESDYDLAPQFFIWEMITSVLGWKLKIHPFNQPDVESAKAAAREFIEKFNQTGELPHLEKDDSFNGVRLISGGKYNFRNASEFFNNFKDEPGLNGRSYVSLQAYVPYDYEWNNELKELKIKIAEKLNCPVTVGYGPRFLHSTGQLHKGDGGAGLFIQIFAFPKNDLTIPELNGSESNLTFGKLIAAQSMGDRQALLNKNRNIIRFDTDADAEKTASVISDVLKL